MRIFIILGMFVVSSCFGDSTPELDKRSVKSSFASLLENTQLLIDRHLNKIGGASLKTTPSYLLAADQDLHNLRQLSIGLESSPATKIIASYCQKVLVRAENNLRTTHSRDLQKEIILDAWQQIGEVVFLAERFPSEVGTFVNLSSLGRTRQTVHKRCMTEFQKKAGDCENYLYRQQKGGVQDPSVCLSLYQAKTIAKILLTSSGRLNLGMIPLIKAVFIPEKAPLDYQIGMDRVFSSMNSSWQSIFDQMTKPADQNTASEDIIRADLGLTRKEVLTDFHSKWCALRALLSQLNQGATGDCFAVAWAIRKHDQYFTQALTDYGQLLRDGYLTRIVDGSLAQFYFKNSLADTDLQAPITLTSSGAIGDGKEKVWMVPGVVAACLQMGLEDVHEKTSVALAPLFQKKVASVQTTPAEIIKCFATLIARSRPDLNKAQLLMRGEYGFSLTQNHLLRAWETALAAMAEAKRGDYVRDQLMGAVDVALKDTWTAFLVDLPQQKLVVAQMQKSLETTLNQLNRYVYDAAIPMTQASSDGNSTNGGFELYQYIPERPAFIGQRIETPDELVEYFVAVSSLAAGSLQETFSSTDERAALDYIESHLIEYFKGPGFLKDLFYAYDDANQSSPDPVANYQNLEKTPMTTLDGDNPYAVAAIDTGISFVPYVKSLNPKNPYDLIKWILDLAKWKEETGHYLEDDVPNELDPATSPQHAFNITFENQDIKDFVQSADSSDQWLVDHVLKPNQAIAGSLIDDATKKDFSANFLSWVVQNAALSKEVLDDLNCSIVTLNQKEMSIQNYASSFLKSFTTLFHLDDDKLHQLSLIFDSIFLHSLPPQLIGQLSQTAIPFALTNWNQGDKDLYFCTFFNPREATLSFGLIGEDKTGLDIMDEYAWVDNQPWEVVPVQSTSR